MKIITDAGPILTHGFPVYSRIGSTRIVRYWTNDDLWLSYYDTWIDDADSTLAWHLQGMVETAGRVKGEADAPGA